MLKELRRLADLYGPSGYEGEVRRHLFETLRPVCDHINDDGAGNLIAFRKGIRQDRTLMITTPMDQAGLIVVGEHKRLRVVPYGEVDLDRAAGGRVRFADGTVGIVQEQKDERYIEIGSGSDNRVRIGDIAVFSNEIMCNKGFITGSGLHGRTGCSVLISVIRSVRDANVNFDTYFVFTTRNKQGMAGASYAARELRPTMAVSVEALRAAGLGGVPTVVKLGKGPVIRIRDVLHLGHKHMKHVLIAAAEQANLPYQLSADQEGASDAAAIHIAQEGVLTGNIAVPIRYLHTPNEACCELDLNHTARLVEELVSGIGIA